MIHLNQSPSQSHSRRVNRSFAMSLGTLALLAGLAQAQPVNDLCENAINVDAGSLPTLTDPIFVGDANIGAEAAACVPIGHTVWWKITPQENINVTISTCDTEAFSNTVFDTVLSVYTSGDGTCDSLSLLDCSDDECFAQSSLTLDLQGGVTYYIQAGQYGTGTIFDGEDTIQLSISTPVPPPPGSWIEQDDAGDLPGSAQDVNGDGDIPAIAGNLEFGGADMYRFDICEPGLFSATTVSGTNIDTQLFLFDSSGLGVTFNDDAPGLDVLQSSLSSTFITSPGTYYLAVSTYDSDPLTEESLPIWNDTPFGVERAPDGGGAGSSVAQWDFDEFADEGAYTVFLTGVVAAGGCGGNPCPPCAADFNQDGGVTGDDVEAFFFAFTEGETCGDVNLDGGVTGDDVAFFFILFESGGC